MIHTIHWIPKLLGKRGWINIRSPRWKELSNMGDTTLRISEVEAHNSLGIGERMHGPFRRIYNKIRMDWITHTFRLTLLKFGVKAMKDTIGENGLVPSQLVFDDILRYCSAARTNVVSRIVMSTITVV
jgi:hypothetical protein